MSFINLCIIVLISLLVCSSVQANSSYVMKLGSKESWPPYHMKSGAAGISVRALDCVMKRIKQPYIIEKLPWSRAQALTHSGSLDGFFSASQNDKRDTYAVLSKVFIPQTRKLYFLKKYFKKNIDSYSIEYIKKNFTIGARFSSNALYSLKEKGFDVTVEHLSETVLVKMLDARRMDAIMENSLVFTHMLHRLGRAMDEYLSVEIETQNMGVYYSKKFLQKHPGFMTLFNENVQPCSLLEEDVSANSLQSFKEIIN